MRSVILAYPIKGAFSVFQTQNITNIARTKFDGVNLKIRFLEGAPINQSRSELVQNARNEKADELIFVDGDLNAGPEHVAQILKHDVPVVCGMYSHRCLVPTLWHVEPWSKNEELRSDGLMRVRQSAIGFSKLKLSLFDVLQKNNPDRCGMITDREGGTKRLWEFFPFELVGQNTPASRLKEIIEACEKFDKTQPCDSAAVTDEILRLAKTQYISENSHISEDYNFCRLCRESDIPIFLDTQLIVQHANQEMLPIPTGAVYDMLKEPWRAEELEQLKARDLNGVN